MKKLINRLTVGLALLAAAMVGPAKAQTFPEKPLRLIVTVGPGAPADSLCRLYADEVSKKIGQPIIVENRPGGGAVIAAEAVNGAPADGYTLGCFNAVSFTPALQKTLPWDFLKGMEPVAGLFRAGFFLVATGKLPVNNYGEFLAYAKANPGKLNNYQLGPSQQVGFAAFAARAGIKVVDVGYKGAEAYQALLAGDVHAGLDGPASFLGQLQAGKVKLLFIASNVRSPLFPDIPTATEVGLKDFELPSGLSLWTKAGAPAEAIAKLNAAMNEALKTPRMIEAIRQTGGVAVTGSPENLRRQTEHDFRTWTDAARAANFVPQ